MTTLELLPMWAGVDPDVEVFMSGVVKDDDGDWGLGGQGLGQDEPVKEAAEPKGEKAGKEGKEGKEGKDNKEGYEFTSVVVNLSGTMGTRYLKTSFLVTGSDAGIKEIFEGNKPRLTDVTLNVLSSLSLADLEEPGAKNVIREKLVTAYNQALGRRVAEQVYFSDFVVQ